MPKNTPSANKMPSILAVAAATIALLSLAEYFLISDRGPMAPEGNLAIFVIININILLILLLIFLIVRNLVKLIFEDKRRLLGAKLRTKLVIAFVALSLIPTLALFFVSFQFLKTSLDYWFDVKVEKSLDDALVVGRTYYEERIGLLEKATDGISRQVALKCMGTEGGVDAGCLGALAGSTTPPSLGPVDLVLFQLLTPSGEKIFSRTWLPLVEEPKAPAASVIAQALSQAKALVQGDPLENGELIRVIRPITGENGQAMAVLVTGALIPQNMSRLLEEIRSGYENYRQIGLFQDPIRVTVLITLALITLLILFVAIWLGFRLARSITEPVRMLALATQRVAHGDLDFTLEVRGKDELDTLVRSFNVMTQDLKEAKRRAEDASVQLRQSYEELARRQQYIEIILQNVAAGVISINRGGIVTTVNRSAEEILGVKASEAVGRPYQELLTPEQVAEFEQIRQDLGRSSKGTLQRPMRLEVEGETLSLLLSFTLLRDADGRTHGVVVVFDDLTELERMQRMAAWREVARRIAHEVKNPLTPIQLSAQRLRKKYLDRLDPNDRQVFDRCTNTIVSQVDDLKRLVNEFSNFARMPALRPSRTDLAPLCEEVLSIYREGHPGIEFKVEAKGEVPPGCVDRDQMKRALINLVDNAVAAVGREGEVRITLSATGKEIRLAVADTGPGIAPGDRKRLFEPYFSRKKGGTGLGLAIVNSIVSDHGGRVSVEERSPVGSVFTLILPVEPEGGCKE